MVLGVGVGGGGYGVGGGEVGMVLGGGGEEKGRKEVILSMRMTAKHTVYVMYIKN